MCVLNKDKWSCGCITTTPEKPCLIPHPQSYKPEERNVKKGVPWSSSSSTEKSTEHSVTCSTHRPKPQETAVAAHKSSSEKAKTGKPDTI